MAEQSPAVEELTRRVTAYIQSLPDLGSVSLRNVREQFEPEFGDQIPDFKKVLREITLSAVQEQMRERESAAAKAPAEAPAEAPAIATTNNSPKPNLTQTNPLPEDTFDVVSNLLAKPAPVPAPISTQGALAPAPAPIKRKLKTAKQRAAVKEQLQTAAIKDPKTIQEWGEARADEKKTQATLRDAAIRSQKEYEFLSVEDKGLYTFTSDGNLQVADKRTLPVRKQIRASPESIHGFFKTRQGILSDLEKEVTAKHRDLLRVLEEYRAGTATRDAVVAANQDVQDAERALNVQAKLPRAIVPVVDLSEKDLFPEKRGDSRKIAEPVVQVTYTTFPYKIFWTPEPTANQVAAAAASSAVAGVQEAPIEAVAPPTAEELAEIERKKKARQAFFASRAKRGGGTFRIQRM